MLANYDSDWNIESLTDAEVYAAICYLEMGAISANEQKEDKRAINRDFDKGIAICVCLYVAVLVCLAFLWFYCW